MYCGKCGQQIMQGALFCANCGASLNSNTVPVPKPTKRKLPIKSIILSVVIISLVFILAIGIFPKIVPQKVNVDIKYDRVDIQEFMEKICKNTDAEAAQVENVGYAGLGIDYGTYFAATIAIKPHGMVEEKIQVRFYNRESTDKVSSIVIYYQDSDSENEINCKNIVVEALERSLCGSSNAYPYTSQFDSIGTELTIYDDTQLIASYDLTDKAKVRIACDGYFASDWTGTYSININEET